MLYPPRGVLAARLPEAGALRIIVARRNLSTHPFDSGLPLAETELRRRLITLPPRIRRVATGFPSLTRYAVRQDAALRALRRLIDAVSRKRDALRAMDGVSRTGHDWSPD